jgi:hypothetical protein
VQRVRVVSRWRCRERVGGGEEFMVRCFLGRSIRSEAIVEGA